MPVLKALHHKGGSVSLPPHGTLVKFDAQGLAVVDEETALASIEVPGFAITTTETPENAVDLLNLFDARARVEELEADNKRLNILLAEHAQKADEKITLEEDYEAALAAQEDLKAKIVKLEGEVALKEVTAGKLRDEVLNLKTALKNKAPAKAATVPPVTDLPELPPAPEAETEKAEA